MLLQHPCGVRLLLRRAAAPLPALRGFPLFGLTVPSYTELQHWEEHLSSSEVEHSAVHQAHPGWAVTVTRPDLVDSAANGRRTRRRRRLGAWVPGPPAGDWAAGQTFGQAQGTLKRPHTSSIAQTFPGLRMRVRGVDDSPYPPVEFAVSATQTGPASANTRVHWVRAVQLLDQSGHGGRRLLAAWTAAWTSALSWTARALTAAW